MPSAKSRVRENQNGQPQYKTKCTRHVAERWIVDCSDTMTESSETERHERVERTLREATAKRQATLVRMSALS